MMLRLLEIPAGKASESFCLVIFTKESDSIEAPVLASLKDY